MRMRWHWFAVLGCWFILAGAGWTAESAADLLAKIKAVGKEGKGNAEAGKAWKELVKLGPDVLTQVLAAMDDNDLATTNWLRPAVDAIAEKALQAREPLPVKQLEKFISETRNPQVGRQTAYEWLVRADKSAPARLLPGMLHDPSPDLRRDAVALVIKEATDLLEKGEKDNAREAFRKSLGGACDEDQVEAIAKQLKPLGVEVDLASHFGFIRNWYLLVPFDNTNAAGYEVPYPPEKGVDLAAKYKGKAGKEAGWSEHTCTDPHGLVDLNKVLGKQKGTIAYAYAVIDSPAERLVQIRSGSPNALKIFLNGKQVFAQGEYHHGVRIDQYLGVGTLKAGRNELLLKICQNEQTEDWAQAWSFQVRLTDATGVRVPWKPVQDKSEK
jgi:hypothetical protein